jgi:hypothetical protein
MLTLGALAFSATEVAFGSQPPQRSSRPARRSEGVGAVARRFIRSLRSAVAASSDGSAAGWLPTIRNYPY